MHLTATELLVWGGMLHLIADWGLQNEWMAINKVSLRHPAAWVHGGIHASALLLVFAPLWALGLGLLHMAIDTRVPRAWWSTRFRQTTAGEMGVHVALWLDQVMHLACIGAAALLSR